MKSRNSLRIEQDETGKANLLGVFFQILVGDKIKLRDNVFELTDEIHKALSSTGYTGKNMKR